MAKAAMRTQRALSPSDEIFGPMAAYQQLLAQSEVWLSWDEGGGEEKPIVEMAPPYAINALHKLGRWMVHLHQSSTIPQYTAAERKLYESPLAAALIEQALGAFYQGTYLNEDLLARDTPHIDDVIQQGADNLKRILDQVTPDFEEELLEASITGAVELEKNAHESIGARARILYRILATTITTEAP